MEVQEVNPNAYTLSDIYELNACDNNLLLYLHMESFFENSVWYTSFVVYWVLMFVGALIILVPFLKNEKIRYETEKNDKVKRLYQKFLLEREDKI